MTRSASYIYIPTYTRTYIHRYTNTPRGRYYQHLHTVPGSATFIYIHTYMHTHAHICTDTQTHLATGKKHSHAVTRSAPSFFAINASRPEPVPISNTLTAPMYMYVCLYVYMYVCRCTYIQAGLSLFQCLTH